MLKTKHTCSCCTSKPCRRVCKQLKHFPGNEACPIFQLQKNLPTYFGAKDILSGFFLPKQDRSFGVNHKLAEYIFSYINAVKSEYLDSNHVKESSGDERYWYYFPPVNNFLVFLMLSEWNDLVLFINIFSYNVFFFPLFFFSGQHFILRHKESLFLYVKGH